MKPVTYAGMGAGVVIVVLVILVSMDLSSAQQLQFMTLGGPDMDLMTMTLDTDIAVCNPTGFTTSFESIESVIYYKDIELGTYSIQGDTFRPYQAEDVTSRLSVNSQNALQLVMGGILASFGGQDVNFDPNEIEIILNIEKKILGIIPLEISESVSSHETQSKFISGERMSEWKCGWSPQMKNVARSMGVDTSIPFQEYLDMTR